MMKSSSLAILTVALFVGVCALPVQEDSWSDQDEMLARVFSDATPLTLMQEAADPDTVAHAEGAAETNSAEEADAKAREEAATAEEAKLTAKAARLKEEEDALQAKAETDNAKASADHAKYMADVSAKSAAAMKASADADAAHEAAMAAYNKTLADIAAAGDAADQATKDRLAEEKATADKTASDLAAANKAGEDAAAALASAEATLAAAKKEIADSYASAMDDIIAANNSNNAAMAKEAADWKATFDSNMTSNAAKAAEMDAKLAAEKHQNDADAKAAMDDIDAKYAAKKAATDAAKAAWQAKADADAKALAASRADVQAHFAKVAADAQAHYEAQMATANEMQADADAAHATYEKALEDAEAEQAAIDQRTAEALHAGNELEGCTTEQCINEDGHCTDLVTGGTQVYWISSVDLVSCTTTPTGQYGAAYGAGNSRAGVAAAETIAPIPAPTQECIDLIHGASDQPWASAVLPVLQAWDSDTEPLPLDGFMCSPGLHEDDAKALMLYFAHTMSVCPIYCFPGSETYTDDGALATHGTCITHEDWEQFGKMMDDMPTYENTGTVMDSTGQGRFHADNQWMKRVCDNAKATMDGFHAADEHGVH